MGGRDIPLLSSKGKTGKACALCLGIATVLFLFCFVIFLILYTQERHEKIMVHEALERKAQERDAMWIQLLSSNQTLIETERLLEMKKKENQNLKSTLATTNQTLREKMRLLEKTEQERSRLQEQLGMVKHNLTTMEGHWNSCQAELYNIQENITTFMATITQQAAEGQKLKDLIAHLLEQVSSKITQLADAKREFQEERNNFDRYRQEVAKQAQKNDIPCNKGILSDFNLVFLPFILVELLLFL
ncbi:intraflagellar transport protein 74 homolog [Pituophis catenifer annectens]|uniref:intraflagellar transport protein 74 homolog n=1 Tax=Pituophis catenifer annectens TaxID=94852 RepID=UPI0039935B63